MSGPDTNILRRKIKAAATRKAKASLQSSLVQNIEKATAKVFLDFLGIEVAATVAERTISSHSQTIDAMSSILFGIVGFGDEVGLCGFNAQFIDTAITHLAGGSSGASVARPVTKTDAAIFRLIINKILCQVFNQSEVSEAEVGMQGYELEKAPLMFLLAEKEYALLRVHLSDVENVDLGQVELAIPLTCVEKMSAMETRNFSLLEHDVWRRSMSQIAIDAPIGLNAIVQRMEVSLGRILDMKKGDLLELTGGSLSALSMEGRTASGPKVIFTGHLGALKTQKAFKITRIPDEEHALF